MKDLFRTELGKRGEVIAKHLFPNDGTTLEDQFKVFLLDKNDPANATIEAGHYIAAKIERNAEKYGIINNPIDLGSHDAISFDKLRETVEAEDDLFQEMSHLDLPDFFEYLENKTYHIYQSLNKKIITVTTYLSYNNSAYTTYYIKSDSHVYNFITSSLSRKEELDIFYYITDNYRRMDIEDMFNGIAFKVPSDISTSFCHIRQIRVDGGGEIAVLYNYREEPISIMGEIDGKIHILADNSFTAKRILREPSLTFTVQKTMNAFQYIYGFDIYPYVKQIKPFSFHTFPEVIRNSASLVDKISLYTEEENKIIQTLFDLGIICPRAIQDQIFYTLTDLEFMKSSNVAFKLKQVLKTEEDFQFAVDLINFENGEALKIMRSLLKKLY